MYQKHEQPYVGKQTVKILSVFYSKYHSTSHEVQCVRNKNIYVYIKIGLEQTKILQFPHKFYESNIQTTKRSILTHIIVLRDWTYCTALNIETEPTYKVNYPALKNPILCILYTFRSMMCPTQCNLRVLSEFTKFIAHNPV